MEGSGFKHPTAEDLHEKLERLNKLMKTTTVEIEQLLKTAEDALDQAFEKERLVRCALGRGGEELQASNKRFKVENFTYLIQMEIDLVKRELETFTNNDS